MASIRLTRKEVRETRLPSVCVLSGRACGFRTGRTLATNQGWLFLLPLMNVLVIILWLLFRKTVTLDLPLIPAKKWHWLWRRLVGATVVLTGVAVGVVGLVLMRSAATTASGGNLFVVGVAVLILGVALWLILWHLSLRVTLIDERHVKLVNVHPAFVEAVERMREERRRAAEKAEDAERDARRKRATPPVLAKRPVSPPDDPILAHYFEDDGGESEREETGDLPLPNSDSPLP